MFCKHKFGKVDDGYQYCEKCGKAVSIECSHNWKNIDKYEQQGYRGQMCDVIYIDRCVLCGSIKKTKMNE